MNGRRSTEERRITIKGGIQLSGEVKASPSKSFCHRALICAALSRGWGRITNFAFCDDTLATATVLEGLGAEVALDADAKTATARGCMPREPEDVLACGESASTLRMVLPIAACRGLFAVFSGRGSLLRRPVGPVLDALESLGTEVWSRGGRVPVAIRGVGYRTDQVRVSGDFGSQHISGLLLSAPLSTSGITIYIEGNPSSKPYIDLTVHVMKLHEVSVERDGYRFFRVNAGQGYEGCDLIAPGDYASASFIVAAAVSTRSRISILGLPPGGFPDSSILDILRRMGAGFEMNGERLRLSAANLKGIDIDCGDIPDLVPPIAVMGCFAKGTTRLRGISRLSTKESSRVEALVSELGRMGAKLDLDGEGLRVEGLRPLKGCAVRSWGDHRIEMALSAAALGAEGETAIRDAMSVSKSYPDFYEDLVSLGAEIHAGE